MKAERMIDALSEVLRIPSQLLPRVIQNQYDFVIGLEPIERTTDEDPPCDCDLLKEVIPIDEYLGLYDPNTRQITLFEKSISDTAKRLECNSTHLKYIVKLHEYGYALVHLGLTPDQRQEILRKTNNQGILSSCTQLFCDIEKSLHENIAQLLTFHALQTSLIAASISEAQNALIKMVDIFHQLQQRQPRQYHISDLLQVPLSRIEKGFDLVKRRKLVGEVEAWKTVLTW